ncbi:hypothetical protein ACFQZO_23510 [Bradyrhizobium sp. GCM10027634]|uniref:hypothetical protein n=1 Tax=unclassified Bradyrhizobium TaxID=2631580 RepID=UPI00263A9DD0|nr:hypothetical protein [Bradyrhizobium sp. WYCCWR 12677]MDN5003808.1 hypothetical protein [Bradyrhizobium sp. WYCCWR 12677]
MTTQSHSALTTHSAPFSLTGVNVSASLTGTMADGTDPIELQQLVGGAWRSLDPPIRFISTERGGTKQGRAMSTATAFRWTLPGVGHSISTNVTST